MKGLNKIEEQLNKKIISLVAVLKSVIAKLIPQKTTQSLQAKKKSYQAKKKELASKVKSSTVSLKKKTSVYKTKAISGVNKAKSIDVKKLSLKHIFTGIFAFIIPNLVKLKSWYFTLKPQTIAIAISGTTIASLASLNIYVQSQKISEKAQTSQNAKQVEKVQKADSLTRRPSYYKKDEKQFLIEGVHLPIYFTGKPYMKRLELDFTIQASNKYIRAYLNKNHHLLRDSLNTNISSVDVDFPLKEEGKIIIKDKIKTEVNLLLKRINIEGEITEVHIHSIFGG
jgi:hypothetical protein